MRSVSFGKEFALWKDTGILRSPPEHLASQVPCSCCSLDSVSQSDDWVMEL